jgi:ribose transport system substrate-binding protein
MKPFRFCLSSLVLLLIFASATIAADKSYTIAVIPKGTTHEFWKTVHAGAIKAQRELKEQNINVEIIWKGPLREDDRDQQIQVVENFMTRHVSGIVLAPLDFQALAKPVESATEAGVPVVVFDSALKSDKYVSFVATDNYKGGQLAAEEMGKLLDGKGNVVMLRYAVGSASTEMRESGFVETIKKEFPDIKLVSIDQHSGATRELAYQAAQNLMVRYGRDVDGAFAPNENSIIGLTKAIKEIGKGGGKVKVIGFDTGEISINDMKNGDVQALVVQNPMAMGYLGVKALVDHLEGKPVEKRIDTGVQIVTRDNMDQPDVHDLLHPPLEKYLN